MSKNAGLTLRPEDEHELIRTYLARRPIYERVLEHMIALLNDYRHTHERESRVHSVKGRIKSFDSLREKAVRDMDTFDLTRVFSDITDVVGVRVVCSTLEGRQQTCRWIASLGEGPSRPIQILEAAEKSYATGYRSHHFLARIVPKSWPGMGLPKSVEAFTFEIQVRTILEEAWGEVEHKLVYKSPHPRPPNLDADTPDARLWRTLRERFVAMSARLHESDLTLQDLERRVQQRANINALVFPKTFDIDAAQLQLPTQQRDRLALELRDAAKHRAEGDFEAAVRRHERLLTHPDLPDLTAGHRLSIQMELAYDHLLAGREAKMRRRVTESHTQLARAEEVYTQVRAAAKDGIGVFVPMRMAEVHALRGKYSAASQESLVALEIFDKHGQPPFAARKLRRATLARTAAYYLHKRWICEQRQEDLAHAKRLSEEAAAELEGDLRSARETQAPERRTLQREYLLAFNTRLYILLRAGTKANLAEAHEALTAFDKEGLVSPDVAEQVPSWLDTRFGIQLAALPTNARAEMYEELECLRRRLLDFLDEHGSLLDDDDFQSINHRIRTFEKKAYERRAELRRLAKEPLQDEVQRPDPGSANPEAGLPGGRA